MKILLVEDDQEIAAYVKRGLNEEGHVVDHSEHGSDGLLLASTNKYDILIVDRMLPELDGLALVKTLRGAGSKVPVLFLTALGGIDDRVEGLEAGGDDYVTKPFAFSELNARVNALARRPPLQNEPTCLQVADLELDVISRTVRRAGQEIELPPRQFKMLELLMRNEGRVLTRTMLLEQVWDFHFDPKTSVVETNISRLRSAIDRSFNPKLLHTVRSIGYSIYESK
ncbi:MAG: response regulator transcription factor [Hyphomicrobiaceae bacterium]|nr:response regulator transcription factor [Hyphomicrobiaceae bacterium]